MNTLFKTVTSSLSKTQQIESVVPFQHYEDVEHHILIEDLLLKMSIGILPEEKQTKQNVLVTLNISIKPKTSYEDDIENTLSYADVIEDIQALAASKHFNLVETFAEEITQSCFNHIDVLKVSLKVKKPDIISEAKAVGFAMVRQRAAN